MIAKREPRSDDRVTLIKLVDLLAPRVREPGETLRTTKDKALKRLRYAEKTGELARFSGQHKPTDGRYVLGPLVAWARSNWPGKLNDLPAVNVRVLSDGLSVSDTMSRDQIPGDLPRCQEALKETRSEAKHLATLLHEATEIIERLRPLADRYEENREKNRAAAKKPRTRSQ